MQINEFANTLNERVNFFLKTKQNILPWPLYLKGLIILLSASFFYIQAMSDDIVWFDFLPYWTGKCFYFLCLGIGICLIGFGIFHDAGHGVYTKNKILNYCVRFIGNVVGGDGELWKMKHDTHHKETNIAGKDKDIEQQPFFRLSPYQSITWGHKYQHIYCFVLYSFLTINWFYVDDFKQFFKNIKQITIQQRFVFVIGKAIHFYLFLYIPFSCFGWIAVFYLFIMHVSCSLLMSFVFQMAHIVDGVEFYDTNTILDVKDPEWILHELSTTSNFAIDNSILTWFVGALNFQIEHHLYPGIPHIYYPEISIILRDTCREYDIPYNQIETFGKAIKSHIRFLKKLGKI